VESVEDIPVAVKNKMNINFTLNLDERWVILFHIGFVHWI
jgi:hypothetical protein